MQVKKANIIALVCIKLFDMVRGGRVPYRMVASKRIGPGLECKVCHRGQIALGYPIILVNSMFQFILS